MPSSLANTVSLPYYQLIGAPLTAMIQAETLAAQATAEFIETVGFVKTKENDPNSFGKLKTVTFLYQKQDVNGKEITDELEIPLLSLLPIPMLQIKDAVIEFNLRVNDITPTQGKSESSVFSPSRSFKGDRIAILKGSYAGISKTNEETKTDVDMKVKINVVQSDIPAGLARLFQVFDIGTISRSKENQ